MIEISGKLMSGDTLIAVIKNSEIIDCNEALLPLYLKRTRDIESWLASRAIDSHRTNSRLLKKVLRLRTSDDAETALAVNAATITDRYWFKPEGAELCWKDVRFKENFFDKLALRGDPDSFSRKPSRTPELTNTGSFEKCWKLRRGKWWIYKSANLKEQFSELFVYELGEALGMNMAYYEKGNKCVKSLDFTDTAKVIFEPALSFMGDEEDYLKVIEKLRELCPRAIPDYIQMIFLDTITANPDRHTGNFGLLRDVKTGKLLGLAPNFDNNMALIARGYPTGKSKNDFLIMLFRDMLAKCPEYKQYIPEVTEQTVKRIVKKLNMKVKSKAVIDFVMSRYDEIWQ